MVKTFAPKARLPLKTSFLPGSIMSKALIHAVPRCPYGRICNPGMLISQPTTRTLLAFASLSFRPAVWDATYEALHKPLRDGLLK